VTKHNSVIYDFDILHKRLVIYTKAVLNMQFIHALKIVEKLQKLDAQKTRNSKTQKSTGNWS